MQRTLAEKLLTAFILAAIAMAFALPVTAFATEPEVQVENHTAADGRVINGLTIDGVDAPSAGNALDATATVTSAEGATWDIPVLWVRDDLQLSTEAVEGRAYLPTLVFFVPQEYTVEGDNFMVSFSDSLAKLFGGENAISVFDARTGITYIMPISLKDFFASPAVSSANSTDESHASSDSTTAKANSDDAEEPEGEEGYGDGDNSAALTNVDIFCAQTARDVLSDDELEYLINLVMHTLEPQAVNLLIDSFPSFKAAAAQNQIGSQIGLYIYYQHGDNDGKLAHKEIPGALAYVRGDAVKVNGAIKYCYMIGIDVSEIVLKKDGVPVTNAKTGKFTIARDGEDSINFNNTIVHELFHAIMDDFNRTGMLGAKNVVDGYTPNDKFVSNEQRDLYNAVHFPSWFVEGTASAVENVYQFRYDMFKMLRSANGTNASFNDQYDSATLLNNYLNAKSNGKYLYFELEYAGNSQVDTAQSRYVSGYLATLYLAQLAAQKDPAIGSAVDAQRNFSSEKLRMGLDSILKRMHNGETLDQVVKDISTINGAAPLYTSANDFEAKFIKGVEDEQKLYHGDNASMNFTLDFLNYMRSLEKTEGRKYLPNGSILFDFKEDFNIPLSETVKAKSEFLAITYSNDFVESTVPDSVAFAGGGKSDPPKSSSSTANNAAANTETGQALAAKVGSESVSTAAEEDAANREGGAVGETSPSESTTANVPAADSNSNSEDNLANTTGDAPSEAIAAESGSDSGENQEAEQQSDSPDAVVTELDPVTSEQSTESAADARGEQAPESEQESVKEQQAA